jgi:hypothetical protein
MTTYETSSTFNATAGTGSFNGSLVPHAMTVFNGSIPYWILAAAYGLVTNPQFTITSEPLDCSTTVSPGSCLSYLFPGGIQTMIPSLNTAESAGSPYVVVHRAPAVQIDFNTRADLYQHFSAKDCAVYGDPNYNVGVELCIATDTLIPGAVVAGALRRPGISIMPDRSQRY